jgi:hypothetical protein
MQWLAHSTMVNLFYVCLHEARAFPQTHTGTHAAAEHQKQYKTYVQNPD